MGVDSLCMTEEHEFRNGDRVRISYDINMEMYLVDNEEMLYCAGDIGTVIDIDPYDNSVRVLLDDAINDWWWPMRAVLPINGDEQHADETYEVGDPFDIM